MQFLTGKDRRYFDYYSESQRKLLKLASINDWINATSVFDPSWQFVAWLQSEGNCLVFPLVAGDSIHSSVSNLLKSEIAEVKRSMHAFCLHETATSFGLMIRVPSNKKVQIEGKHSAG